MAWYNKANNVFGGEDTYQRYNMYALRYAEKARLALVKNGKRPFRVYWAVTNQGRAHSTYWKRLSSMTFTTAKEALRKAGKARIAGAAEIHIRQWNPETKVWSTYND